MKYAIIELNGKQHKVEEGAQFVVDNLSGKVGDKIKTDKVLMFSDGETATFGAPFVAKAQVTLEIVEQARASKIRVATYKAKSRSRKVIGHKQQLRLVKVASLSLK